MEEKDEAVRKALPLLHVREERLVEEEAEAPLAPALVRACSISEPPPLKSNFEALICTANNIYLFHTHHRSQTAGQYEKNLRCSFTWHATL